MYPPPHTNDLLTTTNVFWAIYLQSLLIDIFLNTIFSHYFSEHSEPKIDTLQLYHWTGILETV